MSGRPKQQVFVYNTRGKLIIKGELLFKYVD